MYLGTRVVKCGVYTQCLLQYLSPTVSRYKQPDTEQLSVGPTNI